MTTDASQPVTLSNFQLKLDSNEKYLRLDFCFLFQQMIAFKKKFLPSRNNIKFP